MFENGKGLTQWALVPLWPTIKPSDYLQILKCNKQPFVVIKQLQGISPMIFCAPWADYKNRKITNIRIKHTTLIYTTKHIQGTNPMGLGDPLAKP